MKKERCVFCDFLSGKRKRNVNGFPFLVLRETKYSVSFLAIDVPKKTKVNILVIPRQHYSLIEEIPGRVMLDIMKHVQFITKALKKKYSGMNIILNNGRSANQRVPHVHFHIYPRKKGDDFYRGFSGEMFREKDIKEFEKGFGEISRILNNRKPKI